MSSEHELTSLSAPHILATLRDACATLYPEESSARVVVADAGLDERQVAFSSRAETNWHNILAVAITANRLAVLLDILHTAYPTNQPLLAAIGNYQQFLKAGGQLDAPNQLIAGATIYGDQIQGDKVIGDKTSVGNISHSTAVAIGPGATASVTITEEAAYKVDGSKNPYLGLRAFSYNDRAIYAGREQLAHETVQRLTSPGSQQTLLFITGASGSGKSSFVQAGLIPLLESHYAAYQKSVRHAIFRPSSQPMVMLADALQRLHPTLTPATLGTHTPKEQINLLLIDQFEELFIQSDASQRAPFCDFLTNLPSFADCHTHILITLRIDYLDALYDIQPLWTIAKEGAELRTMRADDLRNAIQKPLQVNHPQKLFAPELLDRLVQDAGADAALLPLLQVTLAELWKTGKLVLSNYHSLTDAIRQRAEIVYTFSDHASADPKTPRPAQDQQALIGILLDLINVSVDGTDRRDARQRRTRQELEQGSTQRSKLIEELVNARLLSAAKETRNDKDVEVIDIIHESLIENWDRLKQVIADHRQHLQRRARFKLWLGEWLRNGRQDGYLLLTDMQLAEARVLVEGQDIEIQSIEAREFYQRSVELHERMQRRRLQAFMILMLLAITAAGVMFYLNGQLTKVNNDLQISLVETKLNANVALSRQLVAQSANELGKNDELSILLAVEAGKVKDTLESFAAIRAAITRSGHTSNVFYGHTNLVWQSTWSQNGSQVLTAGGDGTARIWDVISGQELVKFSGHTDVVIQATWSKDEDKILTTGSDGTARIWDATSGSELLKFVGHSTYVWQATWNKDESKILTASRDGTARIWDAIKGDELLRLNGHTDTVYQAIWSKDGSKILTASLDGTARIWDAVKGDELLRLSGHTGDVWQATWNFVGSQILTAGADGTARIWNAGNGEELLRLNGHTGTVYQATWSQRGDKILTASGDGTARVWDAITGKELLRLIGHTDTVFRATWNQDENKILTTGWDGTIRLWDVASGKELVRMTGHSGVGQATWGKGESQVLAAGGDGTVRIWETVGGQELITLNGHSDAVLQAAWSHDGSKILTANSDSSSRVWNTNTGKQLFTLIGHTDAVLQAAWSHDGSKILTASSDDTARIWNATNGKELVTLNGHTDDIIQASWNQDDNRVLTASTDDTVRIWDAANGKELLNLSGGINSITQVIWNRDGSKILTASNDRYSIEKAVIMWDASIGKELVKFRGHTHSVYQVTWNQDESRILTASWDGTARIWDATNGQKLFLLNGHTLGIYQAIWSQDNTKILTASADNTARIWDATSGKEVLSLSAHTDDVTWANWSKNDSKVLTASRDGTAIIWDAKSGTELVRFDQQTGDIAQAIWSPDERKILISSDDGTVRIWYIHMSDLLAAACSWVPRNFTWAEWSIYMKEAQGKYRPTCPNASIPPDAIAAIQVEARRQILADEVVSATQQLEQLNGWLQVNGQFKNYGVNVPAFVAEVSATATAEAQLAQ